MNKKLIISGGVVVISFIIYIVISIMNFNGHLARNTDDELDDFTYNEAYVLNANNREATDESYIREKAIYFALYSNFLFNNNDEVIFDDIDIDQKILLVNYVMSSSKSNPCYNVDTMTNWLDEYFGIRYIDTSVKSNYYQYENNQICFDENFPNEEKLPSVSDYQVVDNTIVVTTANDTFVWKVFFNQNNGRLIRINRQLASNVFDN